MAAWRAWATRQIRRPVVAPSRRLGSGGPPGGSDPAAWIRRLVAAGSTPGVQIHEASAAQSRRAVIVRQEPRTHRSEEERQRDLEPVSGWGPGTGDGLAGGGHRRWPSRRRGTGFGEAAHEGSHLRGIGGTGVCRVGGRGGWQLARVLPPHGQVIWVLADDLHRPSRWMATSAREGGARPPLELRAGELGPGGPNFKLKLLFLT